MRKKSKRKHDWRKLLSILLCVSMIAPDTASIVAYASETIRNLPRYADFSRPAAMKLADLQLASGSTAVEDDRWVTEDGVTESVFPTATESDAELRDPEFFYGDAVPEEPDGILVDYSEKSRTYLMEEHVGEDENGEPVNSYVTVVGESPFLYQDSAGFVQYYDNTLIPADSGETLSVGGGGADPASPSSARRSRRRRSAEVTNYKNAEGDLEVQIPDQMGNGYGYLLSNGADTMEVIPTEGNFRDAIVLENVIRYSNVFDHVDFQYTVLGSTVKEDIILLEKQSRNAFSYELRSTGLKYKKVGNSVVAYRKSWQDPVFRLTAPVMVDQAGNASVDIQVQFNSSTNVVTFTADKQWLNSEDRVYPVRIDPGAELIGYSAFTVNMVAQGDTPAYEGTDQFDEDIYNHPYGDNGHTMVGYSKEYGHCRAVIDIDTDWESLINHSATQTDGPGVKKVQFSVGVMTTDTPNRTPFILNVFDEPWNKEQVTFANVCHKETTQAGSEDYSTGNGTDNRLEFDITDTYYQWVDGTKERNGLMLQVQAENDYDSSDIGSVYWAETIYNKTGIGNGPRIEVAWEGVLDPSRLETLPMSEFSLKIGPGVVESEAGGRSTRGILAHGASQAGSEIEYTVYQENGDAVTSGTVTAHEEIDCPDYTEVDPDCLWENYQDSNWQSEPVMYESELALDTIYYVEAEGHGYQVEEDPETGEPVLSEEPEDSERKTSDQFLLYEVQATDVVPRIARHYGITVKQLKEDNKFLEQLTVAGDVLFIRNPKTTEPYTKKLSETDVEWLLAYCLEQGYDPKDFFDMEPVNMANGSFYMSQTDASLDELGGTFQITRSYNSLAPFFRSEFGMGWSSLNGEKLMVLQDGRIIYIRQDGKGLIFEHDGAQFTAPAGYDYSLEAVDSLELMQAEDGEEAESSGTQAETLQAATGSNAARTKQTEETLTAEDAEEQSAETDAEETSAVASSTGWKISQPDGSEKYFNSNGLLVMETNRKAHKTHYVYDSGFALQRIILPGGKEYGITQTAEGLITDIVLPDGGALHYAYDDADQLVAVTNPDGGVRRYEYDENHRMTAWYDENGNRIVSNVYNDEGRLVSQTDALGNEATLQYSDNMTVLTDNRGTVKKYYKNEQNLITQVEYANGESEYTAYNEENRVQSRTDANGAVTSYTYDADGNVLTETRDDGSQAVYTYDAYANILEQTDYEGNTASFSYDEKGNLLSVTDGAGNTVRYTYDELSRMTSMTDANGGVTHFGYDGSDAPVTSMTDPEGGVYAFSYDAMNRILSEIDPEGNTTEHRYNANGWETSVKAADGGVTSYEFSPAGEVLSITDAMGSKTTFRYDAMHNILSGTDALGNTLQYAYDGNYNRISATDAKGNETRYSYDARDRVTAVTDALGNETLYTLDGNGNRIGEQDRRGNSSEAWYSKSLNQPVMQKDRLGSETYYRYDRNGNLKKITWPDGSTVQYSYDGAGRLISTTAQNGLTTDFRYDGNGNLIQMQDDASRVYRFAYDGNNRLIKAEDPLGGVTEYAYDGAGNQIRVTDANKNSTAYAYDAAGRLKEVQDALGGRISTEYDLAGRVLKTTDQNGHTTSRHYDLIGQMLAQVDAAEYVTAMEYDVLGNVTKVIDALKGETAMETDALSRTVKKTDALGGEYLYVYDENGNLLSITMPDQDTVRMSYDAENRMTHYRDEASVVTHYEYDAMGRIIKAQDTAGNRMDYEYDASGNLIRQTDTIGRSAVYEYDSFNRLICVTGTDQAVTRYTYDVLDRLSSVTQADGTVTTYEYDPVGNLVETTEPGEAVYTYAYDAINRLTEKVNPLGAATRFQYDAKGNLTGSTDGEGNTSAYVYDVLDRLTEFTDARGSKTVYEYDGLSRLLSLTSPEGGVTEYRYDALGRMTGEKDPNQLATTYQYDAMGNLMKTISPKGAETSYTYDKHDELTSETDPMGNTVQYTVDMNRRVTQMKEKNGAVYSYTYDQVHRLTGIETPLGLKRALSYDTADNVIRDTDNLNRTSSYEYDIMHRMTKSTNPEGGVTEYGYDIRGNRNELQNALGYTWNYRYDLIDQLTASVDPEGKATAYVYDLVGNISSVTRPGERTTAYTYDEVYNQIAVTDPKGYQYSYSYDKDRRLTAAEDPLKQTEAFRYDPGSRVTALQDKMGLTRSFTYDPHGNILTGKATDGLVTKYTYDLLDNLTSVTDPMGQTTSYAYDVMGNITSMTNAKKQVTEYSYDAENNLTGLTSPMGRTERYSYDEGGRIRERVTPSGNTIRYDYTRLNALAEKTYDSKGETGNDHPVQMGYNALGQRISMEDLTGESSYTYDALGRLKSAVNGSGKTVSYEYNEADDLSAVIYPDGKRVSYEYDKNANLTKLTDRDGRTHSFSYDPLNRLTKVVRSDGSESSYTWNARNQVLQVTNLCGCGFLISDYQYSYNDAGLVERETAKECLFTSEKDYGHKGEKGSCVHKPSNPWGSQNPAWETTERSFAYDDNGQMIRCEESKGRFDKVSYTYRYDEAGNRTFAKKEKRYSYLESWQNSYVYNDDNQMVSAEVCEGNLTKNYTFVYDANGNLTKECIKNKAEVTYQYDTENRLTAVYDPQKLLMAAVYDGDGNRAFQMNYDPDAKCGYGMNVSGEIFMPEHSQNEDESLSAEGTLFSYICSKTGRAYELTEYVNDINRQYTEVLSAYSINSGTDYESYSYAGDMRMSKNRFWNEARDLDYDQMSYYLYDGRGSVTANTWYNGMVTAVYRYDPYGQVSLGSTEHKDFYGYNGESYNPNTGLEYLRARYYNPNQGRFFQEDTYLGRITDPLSLNRYAYVKNSPLNYTDPSGHFVLTLGTVVGAALIGGATSMTLSIIHQLSEDGSVDLGDTVEATFIGAAGAVVGTATAALVGAGFAAAGVTGAFTLSQSFAIGATTAAASGMAVRANTTLLEESLDVSPKPLPEIATDALTNALNPKAVFLDATMGGVAQSLWFQVQQATSKQQVTTCLKDKGGSGAKETELFLPDEAYNKQLPKFVTSGTKKLPKYDEFGNLKQIKYYDDYGREIGWTDFTNHGYPDNHTVPHWHEVQWNAQYPIGGYKIDHRLDPNPPFDY